VGGGDRTVVLVTKRDPGPRFQKEMGLGKEEHIRKKQVWVVFCGVGGGQLPIKRPTRCESASP